MGLIPKAVGSYVPQTRALRWLLALYVISAVVVAVQRTQPPPEYNFAIFRDAFTHLVSGQDLYAAYPATQVDVFKYSPTFALLFAPFALLPVLPGYILWALVCAGTVFAGVTRVLPSRPAALALAIGWLAVVGDMQRAQTNALCAGLIMLGWAAMEGEHQWTAAAAIITGGFVKLFPIAALAGAIFHTRKWRFALVVLITVVVAAALPLLVIPWHALGTQYHSWRAVEARDAVPLARYGVGGADVYAGIMGLLRAWFGVTWPFWPTQLVGVALLLAPLVRGPSAWTPRFRLDFLASTLVFCVLFNHQAESPSYSIAMLGAAVWFAASDRAWWRTAFMVACFVIVNIASSAVMPSTLYVGYYVKYLIKTVPLVPLWLVMQGELFGLIRTAAELQGVEVRERDVVPHQVSA
ncbi:MAG TPA: glycosyltransferase family 87 protein [Gemmatimonadaceae bacterium]